METDEHHLVYTTGDKQQSAKALVAAVRAKIDFV
jgi:hypothetical protein